MDEVKQPIREGEDDVSVDAAHAWKLRKLIKTLESAHGNGTSMITLLIPADARIDDSKSLLNEEIAKASNIKSRVNRQSVVVATRMALSKLKLYSKTPPNGLALFCGIATIDGKVGTAPLRDKRISVAFEPYKPLRVKCYKCDDKFATDALRDMIAATVKHGFIIMDGHSCLYSIVCGSDKKTIHSFGVDLPNKHKRGGQSSVRFAHLTEIARHNYVHKVGEIATRCFIGSNNMPIVANIILAGSAEFKRELYDSDWLDQRLKAIVALPLIDVGYGGENGLSEAIKLSAASLNGVRLAGEKKIISTFMQELAQDTGMVCYGVKDVMAMLDIGAVDTVVAWEDLPLVRYKLKPPASADVQYGQPSEIKGDVAECTSLLEWLVDNGTKIELVTDRTSEGAQFCKGFGGIGAMLRYKIQMSSDDFDSSSDFVASDETIV